MFSIDILNSLKNNIKDHTYNKLIDTDKIITVNNEHFISNFIRSLKLW